MSDGYNGWTNYATWRVHLELFDGMDAVEDLCLDPANPDPEVLEGWALDVVLGDLPDGLARSYAEAFLDLVNWREIAEHLRVEETE